MDVLLKMRNISIAFIAGNGFSQAVNGISFDVLKNETLGIIGESGSGKSLSCLSIIDLLPETAFINSGSIVFDGKTVLHGKALSRSEVVNRGIGFVFQEPKSTLNPVRSIGSQLNEVIRSNFQLSHSAARVRSIELLREVGIPEPEERLSAYPHQLSGGIAQRIGVAMALACKPKLLIADEPTTGLDVTIQAQILELFKDLKVHTGMSMILVSHDMGVIAETADRVIVMYAGSVVEKARVIDLFDRPLHPYTQMLMQIHQEGDVESFSNPSVSQQAGGCCFASRCYLAGECCFQESPPLIDYKEEHYAACFFIP
ncbi:MAG: ABC transporter ATP-binding protein [Bacteroidetes bacterium]|nr:ABC transporter ATP-binding protein [Bacteroidota bacterium]